MQPLSLYSAHAHPLLTTQCSKEFVSVTCCCLGSQCILNLGDAHDDACRHLFSRSGAGSLQSLDHLCSCSPCRFNSAAGAKQRQHGYGSHPPGDEADQQRQEDEVAWQKLTSRDPHPNGWLPTDTSLLHKPSSALEALIRYHALPKPIHEIAAAM